ncbi:hypothetical protein CHGG_05158 [Chaetomium globosum CBS 148.51]|uniref:Deacetylase sirtuin-type domain-containing protein n=1 Tax=Chaetomium globosum (strain ATCC 6205 / CBS 148.51 / DSM 1962 / NBRC 6347 / NRRL 1970) TaxID=306901 RepID=Q2GZ88_CHAGB|nr:uncharacterized protein CHGG_05158 [Chaetomium globosum CBS 148.51]EAQ88539.1 hypothetical protein CHGG_05158 [Chaetomium globosum CBS 148.51]
MPTTHVEPGCDPLLQDIANTLWKSRKVVVITGAGISTNSGIPDFRSENGLYSLIQAQFDEAQQQQATDSNSDADTIEPRPAKRQRRTYGDSSRQSLGVPEIPFPGLRNAASKEVEPDIQQHNTKKEEQPRSTVVENVSVEAAPFASSPPSLAFATPRPRPPHLLDTLPASSSPLSSPPQVTYDPYQESTNGSSQDTESSRSQSEEPSSVTTPLLSSQNSFISSRNSLPVMKGRDLFDSQIWSCPTKTSVFYTFVSTLREKVRNAEPTSSHRFVSVLRDSRKLVRCYTQNIDQLEERVGLSTSLSLGVGSRYRFSTRSGRNTGGAKGSAKGAEGIPDASQGSSQKDGGQEEVTQSQEQPQPGQAGVDRAPSGDASGGLSSTGPIPLSQTSSGPSADSQDAPSSTPPASQSIAPAAPNRGVECVFLHGSLAELRCFVCARTASWEEDTRLADTLAGRQPTCPHCAGATAAREERGKRALGVGKLRPDIVLYGEDHPHSHLISPLVQHDLSLGPDMLLILGTSMRVHGLKNAQRVPASSRAPNAPPRGDFPVRDSASSISAAVKSRKRKSAVTWRMVRGVETRVSLNDVGEPQPRTTPVPATPATLPPSPGPVPDSRRLPPPTPTTPKPPPQYHPDPQYKPQPQPTTTAPATSAIDMAITAGFRETDRLIARIHQETRLSRPATPLQLPPLIVPNASSQQQPAHATHPHNHRKEESKQKQQEQYQYHTAKLVPMEPKVDSPGPRKGISSNVGSPVAPGHNPFFLADPLVGWLGYPPVWLQQQLASEAWADGKQQPGQGQGPGRDAERVTPGLGRPAPLLMGGKEVKGKGKGIGIPQLQPQRQLQLQPQPSPQPQPDQRARMGGSGAVSPWCPDEQLRKEQEAAMMLSAMRGTGTAEFH